MELQRYADYVKQKSRSDKYLREEHLPILAVVRDKGLPGSYTIELGNEKQDWDARNNGRDLYEVVQAMPEKEHEIRRSLVGDARTMLEVSDPEPGEPKELPVTGVTAQMILRALGAGLRPRLGGDRRSPLLCAGLLLRRAGCRSPDPIPPRSQGGSPHDGFTSRVHSGSHHWRSVDRKTSTTPTSTASAPGA